jgi:hypothetical protein
LQGPTNIFLLNYTSLPVPSEEQNRILSTRLQTSDSLLSHTSLAGPSMEQNTIVSTRLIRRVPGKGCYLSIPMFTFPACEESLWCPEKGWLCSSQLITS